jgi:uncharacterized protein YjgD (DUF1641 family)
VEKGRIKMPKEKSNHQEIWDEWKDMPEFVQEDKESIKSVIVHFETLDDMKLFSELIGKNITMNTKGFFFPINKDGIKRFYVDES